MDKHKYVPDIIFSSSPLRRVVQINAPVSNQSHLAISTSRLTTVSAESLPFPLIAEKPGVRFKLLCLVLSLFITLAIGFILSVLFLTQINHITKFNLLPHGLFSKLYPPTNVNNKYRLLEGVSPSWINEFDFNVDACDDFYGFVCRKWLSKHPLSPLEFKQSWLTQTAQNIRINFAEKLANLSGIEAYNHRIKNDRNQHEDITPATDIDQLEELTSERNE